MEKQVSNYKMQIDFFGNNVRAETDGSMVCLNDLINAGNAWRLSHGRPAYQMATFLNSQLLAEYLVAATEVWGVPATNFVVKTGKNKNTKTMVHVSVAVLAAEQISPWFHVSVHKTFIEGKLLEFRELGGTEFKDLNAAIDLYLTDRQGKNNQGVFIQIATRIRAKLMGEGAEKGCWDNATVAQIHSRYALEKALVQMLSVGVVNDYEHLKDVIGKL
jgi:hypothetical protein